ncbi:reverse transcriptase [Aphelenchoides avenae]|nr:reverse transcriptase [Aphelenchus avenae]
MVKRHDSLVRFLHKELCQRHGLQTVHFTQKIDPVLENERAKIYFDFNIVLRQQVKHNKPDLVIFDKVAKKITIVEVAVSWFSYLPTQEQIKLHRYNTNSDMADETALPYPPGASVRGLLEDQFGREFPNGVHVVPVVVGCCGEIITGFGGQIRKLGFTDRDVPRIVERLQRSAVLGTNNLIKAHLAAKQ